MKRLIQIYNKTATRADYLRSMPFTPTTYPLKSYLKFGVTRVIATVSLILSTHALWSDPILAQSAQYRELEDYKRLCFTDPILCQDIAKAAEMANQIVYESAEMNNQLARCPWFYESCETVSVQIIDNTIANQQLLRLLTDTIEPVDDDNELKVQINIDNLVESFNRLGGYAIILSQQTLQANGRTKLSYVITFKGTSPQQINDLFSNAYVRARDLSDRPPSIRVHSGFRQYAKTVAIATQPKIQEMLAAQENPNIDVEVLVTGHSLGAAAATIYGFFLHDQGILPENIKTIVFAAPPFVRKGSEDILREHYRELNLIAVENRGDLILDTSLFKTGYELNRYVFPPIRQVLEGTISRSLNNLYKQLDRILQQPEPTVFRQENPNNSQRVAIESKIKIEQTRIHMDSYNQYSEYYLDVLEGDREFNQRLATAMQQRSEATPDTNPENSTSMKLDSYPDYTLTTTINNDGVGIGIHPLAIAPNAQTVISGSQDGSLSILQLPNGEKIAKLSGHSEPVTALAISTDARTLVSASKQGVIKVWNLANHYQERYTIDAESYPINALAISPDGEHFVTGHGNGSLTIWNLTAGEKVRTISAHSQAVNSVVFSPNGEAIASGSGNEVLKLWQWKTGETIPNDRRHIGKVWAIARGANDRPFAISSFDKTIKIWDLYSGEELRSLSNHSGTIWTVKILPMVGQNSTNPDRPFYIYSGSWDGQITVWSFSTGGKIFTASVDSRPVTDLGLTPDGQTLVSSSWDGKIRIWQQ